jgi:hypothetical protein
MKKNILLTLCLFFTLFVKGQDTSPIDSVKHGINPTAKEFTAIVPIINSSGMDFDTEKRSHYLSISVLESLDSYAIRKIYDLCDDCSRAYFLIYHTKTLLVAIEDEKTPHELLLKILEAYKKDNVTLNESMLNKIVRLSFDYFEYRKPSGCPRPGPFIDK